jgi:hypothetical protein
MLGVTSGVVGCMSTFSILDILGWRPGGFCAGVVLTLRCRTHKRFCFGSGNSQGPLNVIYSIKMRTMMLLLMTWLHIHIKVFQTLNSTT